MPSSSTASSSCLKGLDFTTDLTSLSYVEVLPDEMQATTVGFLLWAIAWFDSQGISGKRVLSDNGSAYHSRPWREACSALGLTPKHTRPHPTNQRQSRAVHPNPASGMGILHGVPDLNRAQPLVAALSDDL